MPKSSGSQPGCRGTLGCLEDVLGVPPNFGFHCNLLGFLVKSSIIYWLGCRQIYFSQKGCRKQKKVEKYWSTSIVVSFACCWALNDVLRIVLVVIKLPVTDRQCVSNIRKYMAVLHSLAT